MTRNLAISLGILLGTYASGWAAEPDPAAVPEKLATLLDAKDQEGQPVFPQGLRSYYNGLNDHIKDLLSRAAEKEIITAPEHLRSLLALELRPQKMEILLQDNCILCHTDPESHTAATLFILDPKPADSPVHLSLRDFVEGTHFRRGLSCAGCHGGDPASEDIDHAFVKEWPSADRQKERGWILDFCARCHSDPVQMNEYNPALPTDQLTKFKGSPHGKQLLQAKDPRAPQCVSCHGVHGVRSAKDPLSMTSPKRVPETCGACHANPQTMAGFKMPDGTPLPTDQLEKYRTSVHGRALLERGDIGAPACNDCHGNHAAMPVGVSSVSHSCSLCHAGNASLFEGSRHMQVFRKNNWSQCTQCHGNHAIAKTDIEMLRPVPNSMCADCHDQHAKENPDCKATADYFYNTLTQMNQAFHEHEIVIEELAMKGLDVDPIQNLLDELNDNVKKARSYIHSFNRNSFQQVVAPGQEAIQNIRQLVQQARKEHQIRQHGLVASMALMGLAMVAGYIKLRRLESDTAAKKPTAPPAQ